MVFGDDRLLEEGGRRNRRVVVDTHGETGKEKRENSLPHTNTPSILHTILPILLPLTNTLRSCALFRHFSLFTRLALLVNPQLSSPGISSGIRKNMKTGKKRATMRSSTQTTGRKKMQPREKKQGEQPLNHHQNNLSLNHHLFFSLYLSS